MEDYFEPAIHILHNDGNPSLLLKYISHETKAVSQGVNETIITLGDDKYPVTVKLHYVTYPAEDIIKTYTEISHKEKKPVVLHQYASSMLHLNRAKYYLTEFSGDWAHEANISDQPLEFGKKCSIPNWGPVPTCLPLRSSSFLWTSWLRRIVVKCW